MVGADDSVLMALPAYQWTRQGSYEDVLLDLSADEGIARISINRPETVSYTHLTLPTRS